MMQLGIMALAKSPLARMLAVLVVENLIRYGYLSTADKSQAVEDAVNILGFIAMIVTLLIWQWRAHHPAKAQIELEAPITPEEQVLVEQHKLSLSNFLKGLIDKVIVVTPKSPQQ